MDPETDNDGDAPNVKCRSVQYDHRGSSAVLKIIDRPTPTAGPGQVLVRIHMSGLNPTDVYAYGGSGALAHPQVPGQDGAGIVDAVGEDVTALAVGDRVWVWDAAWQRTEGTSQDLVALPERQVVKLDDAASFEVGASLGIPVLTAHRLLTAAAEGPQELTPGALKGRVVLVQGGAGDVGHAAIQFARWASATVIATVRDDTQRTLAIAAGAHHVVKFTGKNVAAEVKALAPHGVDIITEVAAAQNLAIDLDVIAPSGVIAIYTPGHGPLHVPSSAAMNKNVSLTFVLTYTTTTQQKDAAVRAAAAIVAAGAFRIGDKAGLPVTTFVFGDARAAYQAVADHTPGKVLLRVTPELAPTNE